jgi:hypothetical protein
MVNGWGQARIRFMMEVVTNFGTGGSVTEIIQGYSDYNGVTTSGLVDPQMEFHINSILKIRHQVTNTPFGVKSIFNVVDAAHVLVDNIGSQQLYQQEYTERMRPEDMFTAIQRKTFDSLGTVVDNRTVHNSVPVLSRRKNSIPTCYLSDMMEGFQNTRNDPTNSAGDSMDIFGAAKGYVQSESIHLDAFVKAISNIRRVPISSSFTFSDLVKLDPNVPNTTKYAVKTAPRVTVQSNFGGLSNTELWNAGTHETGMSASWENGDLGTHFASVLANAVPALMMELALTGMHFSSTNRVQNGFIGMGGSGVTTVIANYNSFSNMDMTNHLKTFVSRLEHEILYGLTYSNQIDFEIEMYADLIGDTWIKVSVQNHPMVVYNQPSFADALIVPILSSNHNQVVSMAEDIDSFLHSVLPSHEYGGGMDNFGSAFNQTSYRV